MDITTLQMAMNAMGDPYACAREVAEKLGITTETLYTDVNGDGSLKEVGQRLMDESIWPGSKWNHSYIKLSQIYVFDRLVK